MQVCLGIHPVAAYENVYTGQFSGLLVFTFELHTYME